MPTGPPPTINAGTFKGEVEVVAVRRNMDGRMTSTRPRRRARRIEHYVTFSSLKQFLDRFRPSVRHHVAAIDLPVRISRLVEAAGHVLQAAAE